ncbi:hypothetical protein RHSIM_Rhsim03G0031900 [Rhododendron simsii]|uniref:Uncharacterized protein n=1 Tax=Rhododendron simsii TaxID=118357 RepID=A0A834HF63_RHOSS|nr:hypothetical protein RHSIM_Rhsim03G0031900 [Rhododendron simsii]
MLSRHGDPYTLIIRRKVFCFHDYQIGSDGNLQGVGLFINMEPKTRHLVSEPHDHCLLVNLPHEIIKHSPISSTIIHHRTQEGHLLKTGCEDISSISGSFTSFVSCPYHLFTFCKMQLS